MRKLVFSLAMLLMGVGAWATPITELSSAVVGKVFTIKSVDRGAFVYNSTYTDTYISGSTRSEYGALDNADKNFLFAFVRSGDKYFLYSIGAQKYCVYATDGVALSTEAPDNGVAFLGSTGSNKDAFPTVIAINGTNQLNMSNDQGYGILTNYNDTGDNGNTLAIEAVEGCAFDNTTLTFTENRVAFTYKYTYKGQVFATQNILTVIGVAYPALNSLPFGMEATGPSGTVQATDAEQTFTIECSVSSNFPFKYFSSYEEIDTWYAAKLHSNQTHYMYWTGTQIAFTGTLPTGDKAYGWAFVGDPANGFKVYNNLAGKDFMLDNSVPCTMSSEEHLAKTGASSAVNISNGGFTLKFDGQQYLNYQSGAIKRWGANDAGSTWLLTEIDLSVDATAKVAKAEALSIIVASSILFGNPNTAGTLANTAKAKIENYTYDATSETDVANAVTFYNTTLNEMCASVDKDVVFYNTNRGNKYMVVTDAVQMSGNDAADGTSIFNIKGVEETNRFTIQNKANERYIANTPVTSGRIQLSQTAGEFTIKSFGTDNKFAFVCTAPTNTQHNSLHLDGSHRVVAWEADGESNASVWIIQEPGSTLSIEDGKTIVKNQAFTLASTLKNSMNNVQFGNELGQYSDDDAASSFRGAKDAIPDAIGEYTFEQLLSLKDELQAAFNNLQMVQPNLKAFVVSGKQTGRYISLRNVDTEGSNANRIKMVDGSENADVFLLTNDNAMVSYNVGHGITKSEEVAATGTNINTMTFTPGNSIGYYTIITNNAGNNHMYDNQNQSVLCSSASRNGNNTDWTLTEVDALPIKMNAVGGAYYATFNAPVRVTIPKGLKAYSASVSEDANVLNLTKVVEDGVLEANTPVILYSRSDVTSLSISEETGVEATSNVLSGTNQKITAASGENYVMGKNENDVVGFYKYTGTTMPAFKAYLGQQTGEEVRAFTFSFEDIETSINAVESHNSNAAIYDLSGRRVQKAGKGLYIINGKKVMYN